MNTFPNCETAYLHQKNQKKILKNFKKTFPTEREVEIDIFENKEITNYLKSKPKAKGRSKWFLYLTEHLFIPNLIGSVLYLLCSYIDNNIPCNDNFGLNLLKVAYNSILWNVFWSMVGYYLTILWIIKKIKKKSQPILKVIISAVFISEVTIFEYLYALKILANLQFLYLFQVFTGILYSYMVCKLYKISFNEIRVFFNICLTYFLIAFVNKYLVQDYLILTMNESKYFEDKEIYFKLLIFIYFQLYRNLANYLVEKFCIISKFYDASMIFLKVVMIDLISNSIIPIVIEKTDRKLQIFYVGLFTYQLSIFYFKENFLLSMFEKIIQFILNKKNVKGKLEFKRIFNEFIAISINDIMIIIYLKLLYLYYFRKFVIENKVANSLLTSCFNFRNNVNIDIEHLPLVILIQILMIGTAFFGKKNEEIRWTTSKMNKSRILKRVYEILLFYNYVDFNFQFYFYLSINKY